MRLKSAKGGQMYLSVRLDLHDQSKNVDKRFGIKFLKTASHSRICFFSENQIKKFKLKIKGHIENTFFLCNLQMCQIS
jgi:hypothetical protein